MAATGHGPLALVAVITALYPAVTVVLARMVLGEHWTRFQAIGLTVSTAAIIATSLT